MPGSRISRVAPGAMNGELRLGRLLRQPGLPAPRPVAPHGDAGRGGPAGQGRTGNRGNSVEAILDVDLGSSDLDAIAGRVAGASGRAPWRTCARRSGPRSVTVDGPIRRGREPPPADPQTLAGRLRALGDGVVNERATGRPRMWSARRSACWWLLERGALICDGDRAHPTCWLTGGDAGADRQRVACAASGRVTLRRQTRGAAFDGLYHDLRLPQPTRAAGAGARFSFSDPVTSTVYASRGPRGYAVARPGQKLEW